MYGTCREPGIRAQDSNPEPCCPTVQPCYIETEHVFLTPQGGALRLSGEDCMSEEETASSSASQRVGPGLEPDPGTVSVVTEMGHRRRTWRTRDRSLRGEEEEKSVNE
ncbi:hypothetical protein ILYODFUR_032576 [Ilyodon furcidens]|uniref:Uncharacterized protein n=1 Tax=Ilyodon furcidens TaxID=33524 RepID=A0ABV0TRL4_9TELE